MNFQPELEALRDDGTLDAATAARLIALERRELVSIATELRVAMYAGVALIVAGVGTLLVRNYEQLGPAALLLLIGVAAAACFAWAATKRRTDSAALEYVVLLGALLVSSGVGFAESQYHVFGEDWTRHLLILAVVHSATAYFFASRSVLALSLAALAGWFGISREMNGMAVPWTGLRAFECATVFLAWRFVHVRMHGDRRFEPLFEHGAAHVAAIGACTWLFDAAWRHAGFAVLMAIAAILLFFAFRRRSVVFGIYAVLAAAVAITVELIDTLNFDALPVLLSVAVAAVVALRILPSRIRAEEA